MPAFDPLTYRYASRRNVVYAKNAVACTSVPLGAQIGLDVMKSGGSAVDAAVAMAAAMPLLEPTGNGLGSDCFALVWIERDKRLYGLNASGVAPMALSAEKVRAMGYTEMPKAGWLPTMVPGAPAGWAELNRRFGTKPLAELFAPAISYAEEGYPVPVNVARQWERDSRRIAKAMAENAAPHEYWWQSFMKPDGTPYRAGELFRFPDYAATLRSLAATDCESYYRGALMERIVAFSRATDGYFCEDDFRNYHPEWVEPITQDYRGYTVCEIPPNGHGITVLMALGILNGMTMPENRESAEHYHKVMEAIKLAFADTRTYVADPRYMKTKVSELLDPAYLAARRALITDRALEPRAGDPHPWRHHLSLPPTARATWSRSSRAITPPLARASPCRGRASRSRTAARTSLDPASDNCLAGARGPTTPSFPASSGDGAAIGPFGVMWRVHAAAGSDRGPRQTRSIITRTRRRRFDAPRIQWIGGGGSELSARRARPLPTSCARWATRSRSWTTAFRWAAVRSSGAERTAFTRRAPSRAATARSPRGKEVAADKEEEPRSRCKERGSLRACGSERGLRSCQRGWRAPSGR